MPEKFPYFGWRGNVLEIDLSNRDSKQYQLPEKLMRDYIGGAGINARLLYDLVGPEVDPLSKENVLIFGMGPMVGTHFPCAGRYSVTAKSPLTGIFGDSNAGGVVGSLLKRLGYDHIIIKGSAEHPILLVLEDDQKLKFEDASHLWGLDTFQTDSKLAEEYPGCETIRIGPAGENRVLYASIASSRRRPSFHGRAGMGAVMGSKNLKAIVIRTKKGKVPVANIEKERSLKRFYREKIMDSGYNKAHVKYGSLVLVEMLQKMDVIREKNYQSYPNEKIKSLEGEAFVKKYMKGRGTCWTCPIGCSLKWKVEEGQFAGEEGSKLEFGIHHYVGPLIGNYDYPAILHFANRVNAMGIDSMQLGPNIAMAMECWQNGLITEKDTDGVSLEWGNIEGIDRMITMISYRLGIGDALANTIADAAKKINPQAAKYAFHMKGMSEDNIAHRPGFNLPFTISSRGGDHNKGLPFVLMKAESKKKALHKHIDNEKDALPEKLFSSNKDFEKIIDVYSPLGKGRVTWWHENYKTLIDCMGLCFIACTGVAMEGEYLLPADLTNVLNEITGFDFSIENIAMAAERVYQLEKAFNARLGMNRKHDTFVSHPNDSTNHLDHPGMLDEYYYFRGYAKNGIPTKARLTELGLSDIAKDLEQYNAVSDVETISMKDLMPLATVSKDNSNRPVSYEKEV